MRALTLTQPWATLVAIGAKTLETRSWSTPYRGLIAIHAATGWPRDAQLLCDQRPFTAALYAAGLRRSVVDDRWRLPTGAVVAIATLTDVTRIAPRSTAPPEPERSFGDFTPGRYIWTLDDVIALPTPIPCKGSLGIWSLTEVKAAAIALALRSRTAPQEELCSASPSN